MNANGARMRDHYAKHRATELAAISNPEEFFEQLGERISQEIQTMADRIAGPSNPDEGYVERLGRLTEAKATAESEVLREYMKPGLSQD